MIKAVIPKGSKAGWTSLFVNGKRVTSVWGIATVDDGKFKLNLFPDEEARRVVYIRERGFTKAFLYADEVEERDKE